MDSNISCHKKLSLDSIPKERRLRKTDTLGKLDSLEFFRTPNGSFWDPDGEYFNRHGYDINGGHYSKEIEYIPGPEWLSEYGCYPDEKDKYTNVLNEEDLYDENEDDLPDEFKGDFEDDYQDDQLNEQIKHLNLGNDIASFNKQSDELLEKYLKDSNIDLKTLMVDSQSKKKKTNKKKKKSNKKKEDDEGWETLEEDDL